MKRHIPSFVVSAFIVMFFISCFSIGSIAPADTSTVLPFDPAVVTGTLSNGLRYYLRANAEPSGRVEMRLAVNAGSILEDDDQLGLAHFVEHLAFDGSLHFKKNELQSTLESLGMRFGDDLNASTSYDETIYRLQVPVDGPNGAANLDTGLLILKDWAHYLTFNPEEVEKERKVIQEEWRSGRGAAERIRETHLKTLFAGSRYAERRPIGKMEVIRTASIEAIRRFYADWYRPDLMAVIIVGAIDPRAVEKKIRDEFSVIPRPPAGRSRPVYTVPVMQKPAVAIVTDKEAVESTFQLYIKRPARDLVTESDYRRHIVEYLFHGLLTNRLEEIAEKPGAPFLNAYATQGRIVRTVEAAVLGGQTKEGMIEAALETVLTELERVKRFGFTDAELEREKRKLLSGMERAFAERDKRLSATFAAEYIRHFLENEASPGLEYEYELYKRFIPGITLEEINAQAPLLFPPENRVLLVSLPESMDTATPDEKSLLALFDKVKTLTLLPYREVPAVRSFVERPPVPGRVITEGYDDDLGLTVWTLSNGVRVTFKTTDFKNDEIIMRSFAPGGTSLSTDNDYIPAAVAADLVVLSGPGAFSRIELEKKLAGVQAAAAPRIDELSSGVSGSASPKEFASMLELVYLYFTAAKIDPDAFHSYREKLQEAVRRRSSSPENVFSDTINIILSRNHPRRRPFTMADVDRLDADASLRFYKARFGDASNFNFYFVGNVEPAAVRPLIETWLGGLPSSGRKETWKNLGIRPPAGVVKKDVRMGKDPKSEETIIFHGDFTWEMKNVTSLAALAEALQIRLIDRIRQQAGETYSLDVFDIPYAIPSPSFMLFIQFGAEPERTAAITRNIFAVLDQFKKEGPTDDETAKAKSIILKQREVNLKTNSFWAEVLKNYAMWGKDQRLILSYADTVQKLSREDLKNAARRFLPFDSYARVTLMPEAAR